MKKSDLLWLQSLADKACGKPGVSSLGSHMIHESQVAFLEELCERVCEYSDYFNQMVQKSRPEMTFRVFQIGAPRPGVMLLRGKDKLIISPEGLYIHIKVLQVGAYQEKRIDTMNFELTQNSQGELIWYCVEDRQRVTPEVVAKYYLGSFFIHGSKAYGTNSLQVNF